MKKILTVCLILSLAANAYLFFYHNDQSMTQVMSTPTKEQTNQNNKNQATESEKTLALEAKIKELEITVAEISSKNKIDQARIQELEALLESNDGNSSFTKSTTIGSINDLPESKDFKEAIQDRESVIEQFEAEKVDPSWAYKVQDDITDMIHESDLLLSMSFNGIECKTTKCRVSVTPNEQGMGHKITAFFDVSSQLRESEYSKYVTISDNMGGESGEMYVYLSRPDTEE